jgi:hypothetical protein
MIVTDAVRDDAPPGPRDACSESPLQSPSCPAVLSTVAWCSFCARRSRSLLRVRPAARAQWKRRQVHDVTERQAHGSQPVQVRSGEMPRSPVAEPPASVERPASKRGRVSVRSATSREACSVVSGPGNREKREPSRFVVGEGQGRRLGTWSGRRRTLRRRGAWNVHKGVVGTGEALLGPVCGDRSAAAYNRFGK